MYIYEYVVAQSTLSCSTEFKTKEDALAQARIDIDDRFAVPTKIKKDGEVIMSSFAIRQYVLDTYGIDWKL